MKHSKLVHFACCMVLITFLSGCRREVAQETFIHQEATLRTQAKSWFEQQKTFLKYDALYLEKENSRRRLTLRWQEAFAYHNKNHEMLMVPLRGDTADASPAIGVLFSKNESGEISAIIKQRGIVGQQRLQKPPVYIEAMYSLNGKLLASYVKEGNVFKRLRIKAADAKPSQQVLSGCTVYWTEFMQVSCQANVECTFRIWRDYSYAGCDGVNAEDGVNSEDSWPEGSDGGGDYTEHIGPFDEDEEVYNHEDKVELQKLLNCFSQIPNAGATYSIGLYVDVPVNSDPSVPFTISGNPGNTFIRLSKYGSGQQVHQLFGFYPSSGPKSVLTMQPVNSELHNDAVDIAKAHEFNAKYELSSISASSFNAVIQMAQTEATKQYELGTNNCSHFATALINACLPPDERLYGIPFWLHHPVLNAPVVFTNSPTGLYNMLSVLKHNGGVASSRIAIDVVQKPIKSTGPCN